MRSVGGPQITVGVDGSAASRQALRWAAEEARQRRGRLRVVLVWEPAYLAAYSSVRAPADHGEQVRAAQVLLAQTLRSVLGSDKADDVEAAVIEGVAERVLVDESCTADLLVLGSRQVKEHAGRSVGPVIRGCLNRARCPVMIIGSCDATQRQPVLASY